MISPRSSSRSSSNASTPGEGSKPKRSLLVVSQNSVDSNGKGVGPRLSIISERSAPTSDHRDPEIELCLIFSSLLEDQVRISLIFLTLGSRWYDGEMTDDMPGIEIHTYDM